jgi:uncharacterized repeat protein (TIGR03803 family)
MSKRRLSRTICLVSVFCGVAVIGLAAQTFTTIVSFNYTNGAFPVAGLVQATDGNFYGTTYFGGADDEDAGTVFKISAEGKLTALHSFCSQKNSEGLCTDGYYPAAGLVQATNGNFYGTTERGGDTDYGYGTVFEMTPTGKLTTLYSFCSLASCADGETPEAGLVQGTNGNFYGTTTGGGAYFFGTVFEITAAGKLTTLHSFDQTYGSYPEAGLVQGTNGNFYGTTANGGADGDGTVFEITAAGKLTRLHSFCSRINSKGYCADGSGPYAGLVQATNGNFYGTTYNGGANGDYGTVFEVTPTGKLTTLYSFCSKMGCPDGYYPYAGLVQATNGNLYGATYNGGTSSACIGGCGTLFDITPGGTFTTLLDFDRTDGSSPYGGLIQATNGGLYGATKYGGAISEGNCATASGGCGTVYGLGEGLGPFVETLPISGAVGAAVIILGNNLTGSTSVTFNGKAATFKVVSSTEITTTVPSGATTGPVKVKTPSATLTSNVNFRVS